MEMAPGSIIRFGGESVWWGPLGDAIRFESRSVGGGPPGGTIRCCWKTFCCHAGGS